MQSFFRPWYHMAFFFSILLLGAVHGGPLSHFFLPQEIQKKPPVPAAEKPALFKRAVAAGTGPGSITGTVYEADGSPSTDYSIFVLDTFGFTAWNGQIWNGGVWEAAGLYPGAYRIAAVAGWESSLSPGIPVTWYPRSSSAGGASWVRVGNGIISGTDITLLPDSGQAAAGTQVTISGNCYLGAAGQTAADQESFVMVFLNASDMVHRYSAYSYARSDGSFSADVTLPPGDYYIAVQSENYLDRWWNGAPVTDAPAAVSVRSDTLTGDIRLLDGGEIKGTISYAGPSAGYPWTSLELLNSNGYIMASLNSVEEDTAFTFTGLYAGSYYLKIDISGEDPMYYGGPAAPGELIRLSGNDAVTGIDILLPEVAASGPTGIISGTVTREDNGTPVSGAEVYLEQVVQNHPGGSRTSNIASADEAGQYRRILSSDEPYWVRAEGDEFDYYLAPVEYTGNPPTGTRASVSVGPDETLTLDFMLKAGGSLGGFLLDGGQPIDLTASIFDVFTGMVPPYVYMLSAAPMTGPALDNAESVTPSLFGGYRFTGLPADHYRVMGFPYFLGPVSREAGYASFVQENISVTPLATTAAAPVSLVKASGAINGTIPGSSPNKISAIICFDENGFMAGMYYNIGTMMTNGNASLLEKFYARDYDFPDLQGPIHDAFHLGALKPGRYALALIYGNPQSENMDLFWWGGVTTQMSSSGNPFTGQPGTIPAGAEWIAVGSDQSVSGIDFLPMVIEKPALQSRIAYGMRLTENPCRTAAHIQYALPSDQKGVSAVLHVHETGGREVFSSELSSSAGTAAWDLRQAGGQRVSPGLYLFRITAGSSVYSAKGLVTR